MGSEGLVLWATEGLLGVLGDEMGSEVLEALEMVEMVDVTVSMADTGLRAEATKTRGCGRADVDTAGGAAVGARAGVEG